MTAPRLLHWGGAHSGVLPDELRLASAFAAFFWALAALTVLSRGGISRSPVAFAASRRGIWALFGFLVLGTLMNAASPSEWERFGWAPLVAALAYLCFKLARTDSSAG